MAQNGIEVAKQEIDDAPNSLDQVDHAHSRMENLIDDVLTLARQGDRVVDAEWVEMSDLVEECWRNVDTRQASLNLPGEFEVYADRTKLKQLVENLLRNAVEHAGQNTTIEIGETRDGFYVADDGEGIPPQDRENIFDPGYSTQLRGTGFGLSIVRDVAGAHGWSIDVTESHQGGAKFKFTEIEKSKTDQ